MGCLFNTVIASLLVGLTASSTHTYKAGIVSSQKQFGVDAHLQLLRDATQANVDILVLPTPDSVSKSAQTDNYDEVVKDISSLAKEHRIYIVSQLLEKTRCQEKTEVIRSNLVFDRQGSLVSVYRKPMDPTAACNTTTADSSFTTDFGVTFGVLMPEDLVLRNLEGAGVKNFVVAGEWEAGIPVLAAPQFYTAWAFTTNANLVSSAGIFAGKAGPTGLEADIVVAELKKNGEGRILSSDASACTFSSNANLAWSAEIFAGKAGGTGLQANIVVAELKKDGEASIAAPVVAASPSEDLSQYIIKPLDLAASNQGVQETVCHGQFCCQFYVKTSGSQRSMSYGLAVFEGTRHFGGHHNIGTQNCAVLPCAGSYNRTCDIGSMNNTNIIFDEIAITGSFKSRNSAQFPIIMSTDTLSNNQFVFDKKLENNTSQVTVKLYNGEKLANFGIFGRDFSRDFVEKTIVFDDNDGLTYKIYEYINSEGVQDFFDYVWIRFRVLIFVVSIYVLEMM